MMVTMARRLTIHWIPLFANIKSMEVFRQKNISLLSLRLKNLHTSVTCLAVLKWIYKWVFLKIVETPKIDEFIREKTLWKTGWFGGKPPYFWKHPNSRLAANFFPVSFHSEILNRSFLAQEAAAGHWGNICNAHIYFWTKKNGNTTSPIELFIDILLTCPFQPKLKQLS